MYRRPSLDNARLTKKDSGTKHRHRSGSTASIDQRGFLMRKDSFTWQDWNNPEVDLKASDGETIPALLHASSGSRELFASDFENRGGKTGRRRSSFSGVLGRRKSSSAQMEFEDAKHVMPVEEKAKNKYKE